MRVCHIIGFVTMATGGRHDDAAGRTHCTGASLYAPARSVRHSAGLAPESTSVPLESWDDQINSPQRFRVIPEFNNEAVLDRETQLVWQRDVGIEYRSTVLRTSWETSNSLP